ncbi:MAG: hypothetical protein ACTS22_08925 [Phycisphaerales bacterium]
MKLALTRTLAAAMLAGLPCGVSLADIPPAMARVSADAPLVISISSIGGFVEEARGFINALGLEDAEDGLDEFVDIMAMPGVDTSGSAAIVFNTLDGFEEMDGPPMVALVPVTDYRQMVTNLGGTGAGTELLEIEGEDVYIKDIGGGFAAIAPKQALVDRFTPVEDASAAHLAAIGQAGQTLTGEHTFVLIADVAAFADTMKQGWAEASQQMAMFGQMAGQGEQIQQQVAMMNTIVETFARDGRRGMLGVSGGANGITVELAASFKEGSELAGFFNQTGSAASLTSMLPGGAYIAAFAADFTGEGIRTLLKNSAEMNPGGQIPGINPAQFVDSSNGFAQVIGVSPGGLMGGLFVNTTAVMEVNNAGDFIKTYADALSDMNGQEAQGMSFTTNFAATPEQVGGTDAYRWSMKMTPDLDNPNAQQMQMMMPMLFGPSGGPSGYLAAADDDTVVMTYSTSQAALSSGLAAARDGGGFAGNALVAKQAELLHTDAVMVGYVDVGSIVRMALPMAAMFIGQVDVQIPDAVTPVAFSMSADGGSMGFRTAVPADVITMITDVAMAFQDMDGGGMDDEDEAPQF